MYLKQIYCSPSFCPFTVSNPADAIPYTHPFTSILLLFNFVLIFLGVDSAYEEKHVAFFEPCLS
jgi:hypothetical protein